MANAKSSLGNKHSELALGTSQWNHEVTPSILVFDVNETLIDFSVLEPLFEEKFGDKRVMREWLGHLIMYSMTATLSGLYVDYFTLGQGLLRMVGDIHGLELTEKDAARIGEGMQNMPAHPDVKKGLETLKEAGFRLVTLTNSPHLEGRKTPLEQAGIAHFFEWQFTINKVQAYKPESRVYHMVARDLGVAPSTCCMVAAHVWDTVGAQSAGFSAALVTRPGNAPLPVIGLPQPNVVAGDLLSLAVELDKWKSSNSKH
jgi:2-haloacid dehalogenase